MLLKKHSHGFTLIELMVVVVILGILATIFVVSYNNHIIKANKTKAHVEIKTLVELVNTYALWNKGKYPETLEVLASPLNEDEEALLPDGVPQDPWGNEYAYFYPGKHGKFDIISYGPDGKMGGDDDINSWEIGKKE